ncbi:SulP family inorganic anion transporter [Streptomyces sp. NPDC056178]|uniref:SulP family inorganic anion transporter n=1 Tax=unclassified Streptomyces TaxID=2593676 RepID=UPI0035E0561C
MEVLPVRGFPNVPGLRSFSIPRADFAASLVVFLVALPLCVGVAVASGVPAELGLITGIVGGLVTGLLPGSSLQVSGPAAGLTVLVHEAVRSYGVGTLGVLVLAAGVVQVGLGVLRLGQWFRAVSVAVVQGMLAGIGLVLVVGQLYVLADAVAPGTMGQKLGGLPRLALGTGVTGSAVAVGIGALLVLLLWPKWPRAARSVPAPLVAVGLAAGATWLFDLPVQRVAVSGLLDAVRPPEAGDWARLTEVGVIGTVLAFALIASAESLFGAAAVDRLHDGGRTDYDKELIAQGTGNAVCGLLGSLPMTAVIVRSAANVRAGARTKASRVLHGVWLLLFAAALPSALEAIPVAALASVLLYAGFKLVPVRALVPLWREHRGEALVLAVTAGTIVATSLFEGVLVGLLLAVAKTAWDISHVHIEAHEDDGDGVLRVRVTGHATFLRLPKLLDALDGLPHDRTVVLDLSGLHHTDHACAAALEGWAAERKAREAREEGRPSGQKRDGGDSGGADDGRITTFGPTT